MESHLNGNQMLCALRERVCVQDSLARDESVENVLIVFFLFMSVALVIYGMILWARFYSLSFVLNCAI